MTFAHPMCPPPLAAGADTAPSLVPGKSEGFSENPSNSGRICAASRRRRQSPEAKLRARIERAVDRLLLALDALDAVAEDLEEAGDAEPSLAARDVGDMGTQEAWDAGDRRDHEDDAGDNPESDDAELGIADKDALDLERDGEPALGSFDRLIDQGHSWRTRDGFEPADSEVDPTLCGTRFAWHSEGGVAAQKRALQRLSAIKAGKGATVSVKRQPVPCGGPVTLVPFGGFVNVPRVAGRTAGGAR